MQYNFVLKNGEKYRSSPAHKIYIHKLLALKNYLKNDTTENAPHHSTSNHLRGEMSLKN